MGKKHQKHLPENATPTEGAELARREAGLPATRTAIARWTAADLSGADKIQIDGLEVFANHGVYSEECALGQKFVVSLTLYADLHAAGRSDDLAASIDMVVAHELVHLMEPSHNARFHALLDTYCPRNREASALLRRSAREVASAEASPRQD